MQFCGFRADFDIFEWNGFMSFFYIQSSIYKMIYTIYTTSRFYEENLYWIFFNFIFSVVIFPKFLTIRVMCKTSLFYSLVYCYQPIYRSMCFIVMQHFIHKYKFGIFLKLPMLYLSLSLYFPTSGLLCRLRFCSLITNSMQNFELCNLFLRAGLYAGHFDIHPCAFMRCFILRMHCT